MNDIARARKRYARSGEAVTPGGPIFCDGPHRSKRGWRCEGFVGVPPVGARLVATLEHPQQVEHCLPNRTAMRCDRCKRSYVFDHRIAV